MHYSKKFVRILLTGLIVSSSILSACPGNEQELQKCEVKATRYSPTFTYIMDRLAQSNSLRQFAREERRLKNVIPLQQTTKSANVRLFEAAQKEIGILPEDILPVVESSKDNNNPYGRACTSLEKIVVFKDNFDSLPYGAKRITSLHEAFHHKYHDASFEQWVGQYFLLPTIGTTLGLSLLASLKLNYSYISSISSPWLRRPAYIAVPATAVLATTLLNSGIITYLGYTTKPTKYDLFKEYRADHKAVMHSQCHECVLDFAKAGCGPQPYLQLEELNNYYDAFKAENKLCQEHKQ